MQQELENGVLWVDEAGLLGTKDMTALLTLATDRNARLILGAIRASIPVSSGRCLAYILNTVGGIQVSSISKIYRQKEETYRAAVNDLSKGDVGQAFEKLESIGAIKTIDPLKANEELVTDYIKAIKKGKSALVVSPTHSQGDEVTAAIRLKLREAGMIGEKEMTAKKLANLNLTEAQKEDWRNFSAGNVIQFNQNVPGIKRGSVWPVKEIREKEVWIDDGQGKSLILPLNKARNFDVFKSTEIGLSKGDKVQITRNGHDDQERRLNNGLTLEVVSINKKGKVILKNKASKAKYVLDKDFGHIAHAHCITSHASQGKTVDEVLIAQPSATFAATDAKQFYVSVSRGRDTVKIYTDDKQALLEHASEIGDRQSAMELVAKSPSHEEHMQYLQRAEYERANKIREQKIRIHDNKHDIERDYEPRL